jgi:periplasmic protein TonB
MNKRLAVFAAIFCLAMSLAPAHAGNSKQTEAKANIAIDRSKGKIYALYARALRDNPNLAGKFTIEFTVRTDGQFSSCRVISSQLGAPELESQICEHINQIRMEPVDAPQTIVKLIEFVPVA